MTIALLILGLAGAVLSLSAFLAWRRRPAAGIALCGPVNASCDIVFQSREARLFGVPNALLGLGFYGLVLSAAILGAEPRAWLLPVLRAASVAAVAAGAYLTYVLLFRLRVNCLACFASHALNACILCVFFFLS